MNIIGWGKAVSNNIINWGQSAINNTIGWGLFHKDENSYSGDTDVYGDIQNIFSIRVLADGGTVESSECIII